MPRPTECHECRHLRIAVNSKGSHLQLVDFHPETLHNVHTSMAVALIEDKVPGTSEVHALPETQSATNARRWDAVAGHVVTNLRKGPGQSPKTIPVKAIHKALEQEFEDCLSEYTSTYLTSMVETHQIPVVPVCKKNTLIQHQGSTLGQYGCNNLQALKYNRWIVKWTPELTVIYCHCTKPKLYLGQND